MGWRPRPTSSRKICPATAGAFKVPEDVIRPRLQPETRTEAGGQHLPYRGRGLLALQGTRGCSRAHGDPGGAFWASRTRFRRANPATTLVAKSPPRSRVGRKPETLRHVGSRKAQGRPSKPLLCPKFVCVFLGVANTRRHPAELLVDSFPAPKNRDFEAVKYPVVPFDS